MELTNEFEVGVPVEEAWAILTDVERIAPCMPGAQLKEVEGDEYRGVVKVKVGPITAQYRGKATFAEKDDANHVAKLKADGRDTRGNGNANALITATLQSIDAGTKVSVHTDLQVTGKVAQFGRGVLADVSAKLLDQFVENLETTVLGGEATATAGGTGLAADGDGSGDGELDEDSNVAEQPAPPGEETISAASTPGAGTPVSGSTSDAAGQVDGTTAASSIRKIDQRANEPVDLLGAAGSPVAKRLVPTIGALVVLFLLWRWLRGRGD